MKVQTKVKAGSGALGFPNANQTVVALKTRTGVKAGGGGYGCGNANQTLAAKPKPKKK